MAFLFVMLAFGLLLYLCRKDIPEGIAWIRVTAPRSMYAIRVAQAAWIAWEEPAIVERRRSLGHRALSEQRAMELALIERAHQMDKER